MQFNPLWLRPDIPTRFFRYSFTPVLVSLWLLARLWRAGELFGRTGTVFCVWFVLALVAQLFGESVGVYLAGLVAQSALAIGLALKQKTTEIR